ncbi:Lrguk [Phodopus roborovskii]|uniref:Leucine-rich repeat and guanylate kinase domain-containing protein n=1 Tax=Phodopus roborovskii TaxID=109678 RepID=A0AAU9YVK4_PHORO|nr:Lrguk [Phodopus roborovskii]
MAAYEKNLSKGKASSLQGGLGASRAVIQAILALAAKHRRTPWPPFPMGQRTKGTFKSASSYLLQQLIHRSQEMEQQGEEESEESEESEMMMNLEEEFDGVLREEAVAEALSDLGWSGRGTEQVYLNLNLSHCDLVDISILCGYVHLQKLNLSANKIEDLSCVSHMPYLLELNASQNKLTTFFNFKPPQNLQKVDFSNNQISEMGDLSAYHTLTQLILDNNEIGEINGIENCICLTHLSLAGNKITTINGLGTLPIKVLCLSNNQIETITGLEDLKALQKLDLSYNKISSLQGLENHDLLEVINLEDNKIEELSEIEYIENLPILRVLNLLKNPIQNKSDYWFFVIFMLLRLTELDQQKIKVEEKVTAVNKYDPPPEVVAARDHMTHVVNSMSQPQRIFDSTLPSLDAPYPMLILTGPAACGKRELAHRLCRQFNTYFRYGACHTTRPPYFGEGDRVDYHFISQEVFDEMLSMGKFILTFNYGNHNYGLNRDTVEGIARDGLASCIHMEIEGVRSLKFSYFEPRYVLVVPMDKEKYEGYLRRKGLFSRAEIEFAISRVDVYVKINRKFPGYFDAVINADMKTSYLKSEGFPRKSTVSTTSELLDPTDRNYYTKLWAKLSSKKSPVEKESLQRQHETARQALMGKTPPGHTLLFQRGPVPIPTASGLQYFTTLEEIQKSFEICEDHTKTYPEMSKDPYISMKYSTISHPCPWAKEIPYVQHPEGGVSSRPGSAASDNEVDRALKVLPKPTSLPERVLALHKRYSAAPISSPGSNTKPTLPPIPHNHR